MHIVWSSAAVAHLLQGLMCCAFRDALLSTLVVTTGWVTVVLSSRINLAIFWHFCPQTCRSLDFFPRTFSENPDDCCLDQQFPNTFKSRSNHFSSQFGCLIWTWFWTAVPYGHNEQLFVCMPNSFELLPCDWPNIYLHWQAGVEQVYRWVSSPCRLTVF